MPLRCNSPSYCNARILTSTCKTIVPATTTPGYTRWDFYYSDVTAQESICLGKGGTWDCG